MEKEPEAIRRASEADYLQLLELGLPQNSDANKQLHYNEDGRGASIWDTFSGANTVGMKGADCSYCCTQAPCPVNPAMGIKGATGNVACDGYHMVDTDVALMKSMGLKHYRFSIAWPRIFPSGRAADGINKKGIAFYNRLIDKLLDAGITPYVTLYHWDLPQGLLSPPEKRAWWARDDDTGEPIPEIQEEFLSFVDTCFSAFGDRVKMWFTFNEPWTLTFLASGMGKAPCHPDLSEQSRDPYIAAHNILNAHAAAVDLYRRKYQQKQGGRIGITLNSDWREPKTSDPKDVAAALRGMAFNLGWFGDPIFGGKGDYPPSMRRFFGDRLPNFTAEQKQLINGSADFFALNHYGSGWSSYSEKPGVDTAFAQITNDGLVHGQSVWLYGAGWGLRKLLQWVHHRYGHPAIYLTEGGWSIKAENVSTGIADKERALYYYNYTSEMARAINEDGVDIRGYFAWSLMDNYEWERGYVERFGMVYNDYRPGWDANAPVGQSTQPTAGLQVRTRKFSSCWLERVTTENALTHPDDFTGCVDPSIFDGSWTDFRQPHCSRKLTVDQSGLSGHVIGANNDSPAGCDGKTDKVWGPLRAVISGGTVVVDFSVLGGSDRLQGFWNNRTKTIDWGDGSFWMPVRELVLI
jgi:beta-glucosidase/6-phospho-beta-glucosidase/beta-galactosidase